MMTRTLTGAFMAAAWGLAAQESPRLVFRFERPVLVTTGGPHRLAIDVPMLSGGAPFHIVSRAAGPSGDITAVAGGGLDDLRLFDQSGREVQYLIVPSPRPEPVWRETASMLPIAPVETEREKTSGFEADLGDAFVVDRLRIDGVPPPFLKRVQLEASADRSHWILLAAEATLFDLPDARLQLHELGFPAGSYRYFRVTWDDARSGRVPMPTMVTARRVSAIDAPSTLTASVPFERRPSEPGRSRFRVRLPGGRLPVTGLELQVAGAHIMRDATVYEAQLSGSQAVPVAIGRGTLKKVQQGSLTASSLRVNIAPPTEAELDLVVDDGNNQPLDLERVTVVFAELPWIYFESDAGTLTARYGNPAIHPPRYDLEVVRNTLHIESVPAATWGEPRVVVDETGPVAAPPPTVAGAPLDPGAFEYVRDVDAGDPGLVALRLDAAVLAHSRGPDAGFPDVRVIDGAAHQVPYLVERLSEPLSVDVPLERLPAAPRSLPHASATRTVYRLRLPFDRLPSPRLVLMTSARVFQRMVRVAVERSEDARHRDPWVETLTMSNWVHADQDTAAPPLTLTLPTVDVDELLVIVDEGDNSPLAIVTSRMLLPSYRLRFYREPGARFRLAYGRPDLAAPRYDLALLAPQVLGNRAAEIGAAAERRALGATAPVPAWFSPWVFWSVLGGAALVLLALIARLVRT